VVTAHPDDVDFGAAGTVAAFTAAGLEVTYCIATNGDVRLMPTPEQWDLVARADDTANQATWLCCCLTRDLTQEHWQVEALYD